MLACEQFMTRHCELGTLQHCGSLPLYLPLSLSLFLCVLGNPVGNCRLSILLLLPVPKNGAKVDLPTVVSGAENIHQVHCRENLNIPRCLAPLLTSINPSSVASSRDESGGEGDAPLIVGFLPDKRTAGLLLLRFHDCAGRRVCAPDTAALFGSTLCFQDNRIQTVTCPR